MISGFPVHLDQPNERLRWHTKEIRQFNTLLQSFAYVSDWRIAIDGGAYVGAWSWAMARRFQHVLAYEPTNTTYDYLVKNMKAFPNVQCFPYALSNKIGLAELVSYPGRPIKNQAIVTEEGGSILTVSIDQLDLSCCGLIKLDLNGGEIPALYGAKKTLRRHHPVVIVEDNSVRKKLDNINKSAVHKFMNELGYDLVFYARPDLVYARKPKDASLSLAA